MALDFDELAATVEELPTVQAGLILTLGRVRNALELALADGDVEGARTVLGSLDSYSAALADAVVAGTPAQNPHEARALYEQKLADLDG